MVTGYLVMLVMVWIQIRDLVIYGIKNGISVNQESRIIKFRKNKLKLKT